jgi:putative transposase
VLQNPVRAGIVERAEAYPWSSLAHPKLVDPWPVPPPQPLSAWLADLIPSQRLVLLRACTNQQIPYGTMPWRERTAHALGRPSSPRPSGRPPKKGQPPFSRHKLLK